MSATSIKSSWHETVTVGTTPTALGPRVSSTFSIKVPAGGVTVYLGDVNVDTATGFPVDPGDVYSVDLNLTTSSLYAVVAAGTQDVKLLGHV